VPIAPWHGAPIARGPLVWMQFDIGAGVRSIRYSRVLLSLFYTINASFTVHDDLIKRQRITWALVTMGFVMGPPPNLIRPYLYQHSGYDSAIRSVW